MANPAGARFIAITDPKTRMNDIAKNERFRMNEAHDQELQALRHAVRDGKKVARTLGYGPRFLHSTGQLHKGGTNSGVFLQVTCDDAEELPIPALGDFKVLSERNRRILRIHLGADVRAGLAKLREIVQQSLAK